LPRAEAEWLVDLVGGSLGQLDQELDKLAGYMGTAKEISHDAVVKLVAGTRLETAFKLLDFTLGGQLPKALELLDRQLAAGENPVGVLAMMTAQLRKLTRGARLRVAGLPLDEALRAAGVPPFAVRQASDQLQHFGRARMAGMYRLLLQTDLDVKGGTSLAPRAVVERFLVQLAK
ncbi:MAG: DNA polymerase III subunit delta, partial [Planctomycetia bacterium]